MTESEPKCAPDDGERLVEYQAAQASAEHHDSLIWSITNTVWAANLVLLGFMMQPAASTHPKELRATIGVLGIVLLFKAWTYAGTLRSVKNQKYKRCKAIEAQLGLEQHRFLKYRSGFQWRFYGFVTLLFIATWGYFVYAALTEQGEVS